MANLNEAPEWRDGVYQIETSDKVLGGPDGKINVQAKALADRTAFLKAGMEAASAAAADAGQRADQALSEIAAAEEAAGSAADSKNKARQYRDEAVAAKAQADLARDSAEEASGYAASQAMLAAESAAISEQNKQTAQSSAQVALQAANRADSTKAQVFAARDAAVAAKSGAESAATISSQKADSAEQSASEAAASKDTALAALNDFRGRYYGQMSFDPAADPLGNPPSDGDIYAHPTDGLRRYSGGAWKNWASVPSDLESEAEAIKGAGMVGFSRALTYAGGVGLELMRMRGAGVQLVCAGDSIMAGMTSPNTISIPQALKQYYEPLSLSRLTNDAVPGSRLKTNLTSGNPSSSDMVARYSANIYPKRPAASSSTRSILLVDIGANDFPVISEAEVATWCSVFDDYCAQARADGFLVVAFTIMRRIGNPSDNTARNNRKRLQMNDFIRRSRNVDAYVDADQLITDLADTTLVIDGTHPTDAGNRLLARATASEIARIGVRIPQTVMPAVSLAPVVSQAAQSILDKAAIQIISSNNNHSSQNSVPAIGAGDFTVEWWCNIPLANIGNNNNFASDGANPEQVSFGTVGAGGAGSGLAAIYVLPGTASSWSSASIFPGVWNHCAIVRSGTAMTYYLNGVALNTVTFAASLPQFNKFFRGTTGSKWARPRIYSRALSAAEILASYERLSEFDALEASYIYALDDAGNHAHRQIRDRSTTKAHFLIANTANAAIKNPANGGSVRFTTTGAAIFTGAPVGSRIRSWTANVTVAGGGSVNLGDANWNGRYLSSALSTGRQDLSLLSRLPSAGDQVYCNAPGYTIEHIIEFDLL